MTKYRTYLLISTVLFIVLQAVIMFGLIGKGYYDFTRSVAITTSLWIVYTFIEVKYNAYMNHYVRAAAMTAITIDAFFGYYLAYYLTSFTFDKLLHAFGTYAFALFAYVLVVQLLKFPAGGLFKFILATSLGLSIGAFYEIIEFLVDTFSNPIIPSQVNLLDTDLDIVCDAIGAIIAGFHAARKTFINENF